MISLDQAKELDDYELCELLEKRLQILALCVEAIDTNHRGGTEGLFTAFDDTNTLAREMKDRLWENANQNDN